MTKLYSITNTYDHQPQTLNISDCTKPTSYSDECMIYLPPKALILDNTEDCNNRYDHDYSHTIPVESPDQAKSNSKLPKLTKTKRDFEQHVVAKSEKQLEEQKKKGKCRRDAKYSDGTAKFFVALEKSFRQLPKALQFSLKGELFESVLKYEKLALEDSDRLIRRCTGAK